MADEATRPDGGRSGWRLVPAVSIAAALLGSFLTWTSDGAVHLGGTDGPNNGWLVVIVSAFAIGWMRSMARGSWVGVVGVLMSAAVIAWTATENWLDSRAVFGATASFGLLVVVVASVALASSAAMRAVELRSGRRRATSEAPVAQ